MRGDGLGVFEAAAVEQEGGYARGSERMVANAVEPVSCQSSRFGAHGLEEGRTPRKKPSHDVVLYSSVG